MHIYRHTLSVLSLFAAATLCGSAFAAEPYPNRPIALIVPYSPGTGVDVVGRMLAERLSQEWKVPVTVDNRVGANGIIGTEFVAKAPADGYTWLFTGPPHYINAYLYKKLPYQPFAEFKPVVKIAEAPLVLIVGKSSPVNNLRELIAYAKGKPGKLDFSSGGSGSTPHLAGALLNSMAGVDFVHVPYKGGAQALTDTLGGHVFMTFTSVATGAQPVKAGLGKAIGITGLKRSATMPDVPTLSEAGLTGYEMVTWNGVLVPSATPDAVITRIAAASIAVARTPAFMQALAAQGLDMNIMGSAALTEQVTSETQKWKKVVEASGAQLD